MSQRWESYQLCLVIWKDHFLVTHPGRRLNHQRNSYISEMISRLEWFCFCLIGSKYKRVCYTSLCMRVLNFQSPGPPLSWEFRLLVVGVVEEPTAKLAPWACCMKESDFFLPHPQHPRAVEVASLKSLHCLIPKCWLFCLRCGRIVPSRHGWELELNVHSKQSQRNTLAFFSVPKAWETKSWKNFHNSKQKSPPSPLNSDLGRPVPSERVSEQNEQTFAYITSSLSCKWPSSCFIGVLSTFALTAANQKASSSFQCLWHLCFW